MIGKSKNKILTFLTLPIILACMATVPGNGATYPAETPTEAPTQTAMLEEPDSGAVFPHCATQWGKCEPGTWNVTLKPRCATVTASEALHIREKPSEKATVIGYLHNGEQVIIIRSVGAWWKVDSGAVEGYSKAEYLQESECE